MKKILPTSMNYSNTELHRDLCLSNMKKFKPNILGSIYFYYNSQLS